MEQVIAYKAFNGRLFDTEDKCIAYEKKLSQYPKVKETIMKAADIYDIKSGFGFYIPMDIYKHIIETQEKPSSSKKNEIFYIVGGRYKFIDVHGKHGASLMNGGSYVTRNPKWYTACRYFAEKIVSGEELTDKFMEYEVNEINLVNGIDHLSVRTIIPNKKWEIDNPRWHTGAVAPYTFTIEKIK